MQVIVRPGASPAAAEEMARNLGIPIAQQGPHLVMLLGQRLETKVKTSGEAEPEACADCQRD